MSRNPQTRAAPEAGGDALANSLGASLGVRLFGLPAGADRTFFRDVLNLPNVDAGDGWLIFGVPPAEVAVHPSDSNDRHELYLMCDSIHGFVESMSGHGIACGPISDEGWGLLAQIGLPGGGSLGVYEPRHARPDPVE